MTTCKWCREEIVPAMSAFYLESDWKHASGLYSCAHHPETDASPADNKWETVYASVTNEGSYLHFHIEVVFEDKLHGYDIRRLKSDLENSFLDIYRYTLDLIVGEIEHALWMDWVSKLDAQQLMPAEEIRRQLGLSD